MRRILVNPHPRSTEKRKYGQNIESTIEYTVDFSLVATDRGTTVSSVAWSSEGYRQITISNEALTDGVATADVSASESYSGEGLVKVTATFADGATELQYIEINVRDPEYNV